MRHWWLVTSIWSENVLMLLILRQSGSSGFMKCYNSQYGLSEQSISFHGSDFHSHWGYFDLKHYFIWLVYKEALEIRAFTKTRRTISRKL